MSTGWLQIGTLVNRKVTPNIKVASTHNYREALRELRERVAPLLVSTKNRNEGKSNT